MKEILQQFLNIRQFHICMIFILIITILFIVGVVSLIYTVEGEGNLPFNLSKIAIISNVEGVDMQDSTNIWNLNVNQNNDIYLYVKKNEEYKDTEIIENVVLDNFKFSQFPKKGEAKILKPDSNMEGNIFKNTTENEVDRIEFIGGMDSSIKELKISNQGGLVIFRYAINNLGNYISNDDEEINHTKLLKNLNIKNEDLKTKLSFDMYINLNSKKSYKASISLDFPVKDVVNEGTQSMEIADLENIVFKRI